jgi:hypothetical protein
MKHRAGILLIGFVCIGLCSGCAALVAGGAAGVGTLAFVKGVLRDRVDASPQQCREAINRAVKDLELKEIKSVADRLSGDYILETGKDDKINIRYEKISDHLTEISIRVGLFGDENLSHALLEEIRKNL